MLDTDVVLVKPVAALWAEFERFAPSMVLGVANEAHNMYQRRYYYYS